MSNSTLWSKINLLLQEMPASSEQTRSAEDFAEFFRNKIRLSTAGSPSAVIQQRDTPTPCVLRTVSTDEITKIMNESPENIAHWIMHHHGLLLCPQLAQTIANMCNASFAAGVLPASQKHTIVKLRLKKPTLDPHDRKFYRFICKTTERVVAVRCNEHCDSHKLLPIRQSVSRRTEPVIPQRLL